MVICVIHAPNHSMQDLARRRFMTIFDQIFEAITQGFLFTFGAALFFIFGVATGFFDGF